jgi:hypothetical protein
VGAADATAGGSGAGGNGMAGVGAAGAGRRGASWLAMGGPGVGRPGAGCPGADRPGAGCPGADRPGASWLSGGAGALEAGGLNTAGRGAGCRGACGLGSDSLGSGQLDGERRITGAETVGGWAGGGAAAAACRPGTRLERKSKPQDSQNWPDRAVPQFGHGSLCRSGWADGGAGGRVGPDDGAVSGQGAGARVDSTIRIPHVSQKSVLPDS